MTEHVLIQVGDDVDIHCRLDGPEDGLPVVLLHGYMGNGTQWDESVAGLVATGHRVVRPDFRGHGGSTDVGDEEAYTFDALRADTIAVVDALGIDSFHLVGQSMGGLVATLVAIGDGDRLQSLMLVDCSPLPGRSGSALAARLRRVVAYRVGAHRLLRWLAPVLSRISVGQDPARSTADRRRAIDDLAVIVGDLDPAAFVAFWNALQRHDDLRPRLDAIRVPTTVIVGEHEIDRLRAGAEALEHGIAGAVLVEIPGAGHSPPMERPEAFTDALLHHLLLV